MLLLDPGTWGDFLPVILTVCVVWAAFALAPQKVVRNEGITQKWVAFVPVTIIVVIGVLYFLNHFTFTEFTVTWDWH